MSLDIGRAVLTRLFAVRVTFLLFLLRIASLRELVKLVRERRLICLVILIVLCRGSFRKVQFGLKRGIVMQFSFLVLRRYAVLTILQQALVQIVVVVLV